MEKATTWLLVLLAIIFLASPQVPGNTQNTEIISSAENVDEQSEDEAIIAIIVIIVIIIGISADACEQEEIYEN